MGLDRTRRDWIKLGKEDPLWAVLVTPEARHEGWDPEAFLATGREEVDAELLRVRSLGLMLGTGRAIDFGSGAGRLTQGLRRHFDEVVGVDFSPPMVERARALDPSGSCKFALNDRPDLQMFEDGSFDLAYSALVLQHIPTANAMTYLSELVRVVRPGGVVTVQVATRPDSSGKGRLAAALPLPLVRFMQRRILRYPAPMDMYAMSPDQVVQAVGTRGRVVDALDEPLRGGHWLLTRYVVDRLAD